MLDGEHIDHMCQHVSVAVTNEMQSLCLLQGPTRSENLQGVQITKTKRYAGKITGKWAMGEGSRRWFKG